MPAGLGFAVVRGRQQDVVRTGSRRAEPRVWLRSVVWLVGAGLHPKAGPTTLVVAEDLASRMDFRRGIVLYDLEGTARRVGVSVATVKRHVAVLRELGALVWLVHGSKRNLRLPGRAYTATATVYGAVIPRVYDAAMGHRLSGSGYEARVCGVTGAGRERAVAAAASKAKPVDNRAVDNSSSACRAPHSPGRYHRSPEAEVESGSKDTSRERASRSTASPRTQKSNTSSDREPRRTAGQVRRSVWITRQVRARVNWTQGERLRRLEFVLRPFTDAGWDADTIAAELHSWMLTWRPAHPAAFIRAQLAQQAAAVHQAEQFDTAEGWDETEASGAFTASRPDLVRSVLDGLAQGMAAYSARQAEQGLDDLTGADAAADMAAFLGTGVAA
ncbi:cell wall protein [Streptomyces sp. 35G-GA-8]|uniref:cell wall protein n=1 Tax=Streptomyces sp. 35G-GA-8 TaxID=2939434 RepID=UPI00201F3743|nr:cell wall protein [Streptomyces sp. 35G-GA-8]MCL7382185.1 cell wall protein [Streptomyces sp. 35G-GA-8]